MTSYRFPHRATVALLVFLLSAAACAAFAATPVSDQAPNHSLASPCAEADASPRTHQAAHLLLPDTEAPPLLNASIQQDRFPDAVAKQYYSLAESGQLLSRSSGGNEGFGPEPAGKATAPRGKDWAWRRASAAEYAGVIIATAGALYIESAYGNPREANWKARNGVDESVRDLLRLRSRSGRVAGHAVGDVLMAVMIAAPVIDSFATLGVRHSRWDALWQTSMINLDSFAFTSLASSLMQNLIAREKPFARDCVDGRCEAGEPNRSMPSGHVAFAFTGAGLICNHHDYQSLYGNPAADRAVCTTGLVLAAADGVARIMADRHYFTDVAAGTVLGLFSGFVLPRLLHYYRPSQPALADRTSKESLVKRMTLTPQVLDGGGALNCDLRF